MQRYHSARRGDVNAFFGLMLDNVAVMIILFTGIVGERPLHRRVRPDAHDPRHRPGRADRRSGLHLDGLPPGPRTGRDDVTAMPLGLDTPSTFGVAFLVLLPGLRRGHDAKLDGDRDAAMEFAWHVGLLALVLCGVFKLLCAPFGNAVRRLVPRAGLLGSLAAIALVLIAFLPLLLDGIAAVPLVGMVALVLILVTLVAHRELPCRFPGALAAVLVGVGVYWLGRARSTSCPPPKADAPTACAFDPLAMVSFYGHDAALVVRGVHRRTVNRLPVVLPFALATIVGGIDCTESAAAAGDEYDTRAILLTEGVASLAAGLLGGVIQTTPYIGHPAYKKMGGRAAYTLATALFVGAGRLLRRLHLAVRRPARGGDVPDPRVRRPGDHGPVVPRHADAALPGLALAMLPALAALSCVVAQERLRRRPARRPTTRGCMVLADAALPGERLPDLGLALGGGAGDDPRRPAARRGGVLRRRRRC